VIGNIPFDPLVTEAMIAETPIVEYAPESKVSSSIKQMWKHVLQTLTI